MAQTICHRQIPPEAGKSVARQVPSPPWGAGITLPSLGVNHTVHTMMGGNKREGDILSARRSGLHPDRKPRARRRNCHAAYRYSHRFLATTNPHHLNPFFLRGRRALNKPGARLFTLSSFFLIVLASAVSCRSINIKNSRDLA